jgi:TonB family protein
LPLKPVQIGSEGFSLFKPSLQKWFQTMFLRKLWPLLVITLAPMLCLAVTDVTPARVSSLPVPLVVHERQVWNSVARDTRFAAVPHTTTRASCEASSAPEPLATPNPLLDVPDLNITISVSFIIGTDGRVHSPLILESAGTLPDRKVLNAVRTWRYRPALCNGVPTEAEGKIEFSSH